MCIAIVPYKYTMHEKSLFHNRVAQHCIANRSIIHDQDDDTYSTCVRARLSEVCFLDHLMYGQGRKFDQQLIMYT